MWNSLRQYLRRAPVVNVAGYVAVVFPHQDKRRYTDIFQTASGIVTLARNQMAQVKLHWTKIGHSHLEVFLNTLRILLGKFVGKANKNGVVPDILFITPFDHLLTNLEWQSFGGGKSGSGGREDQFVYFVRILQRQQLSDSSPHGMADHDRLSGAEMIHQRGRIVAKHFRRVVDGGFARASRPPVIVQN